MSVVIDSSVVVAALIDSGPDGLWAEEVIDAQVLYSPELVLAEATNVLRRLERTERITATEANGAQEDLTQLEIELFPFGPFADRIWELRHAVTSYRVVRCCRRGARYPLATLDHRLARSAGLMCKFLTPDSR